MHPYRWSKGGVRAEFAVRFFIGGGGCQWGSRGGAWLQPGRSCVAKGALYHSGTTVTQQPTPLHVDISHPNPSAHPTPKTGQKLRLRPSGRAGTSGQCSSAARAASAGEKEYRHHGVYWPRHSARGPAALGPWRFLPLTVAMLSRAGSFPGRPDGLQPGVGLPKGAQPAGLAQGARLAAGLWVNPGVRSVPRGRQAASPEKEKPTSRPKTGPAQAAPLEARGSGIPKQHNATG
ncbi:hypothetical protein BD779DRAFT_1473555 [Infundibulicybe gibba]|nr:hypothetical protein BD779DRAFT_1473555 [Infundibulicybe gibba]